MDKNGSSSQKNSRELKNMIFIITYSVVLIVALFNMNSTMSILGWNLSINSPFITGLIIAYIINILMTRLETRAFGFLNKPKYKLWKKIKRPVCMLLSFLIIALLITAIIFLVGPQLAQSVRLLSDNMPIYISYLQRLTHTVLGWFNLTVDDLGNFAINWNNIFEKVSSMLASISPRVLNFATIAASAIFNFFMGIIFAIYLLLGKEKLISDLERVCDAYLPEKKAQTARKVADKAHFIFTSFFVGQLTEAIILGAMYFVGTSIFRMPYAPLISTLMAISSLIPMFGPIIGAVPSAFILLMVDPKLAIIFVIMAIVFQQIEGNFIYPKIVGDSVGLPGIWVLFAILVGGSLAGAIGMILSVPFASLAYALIREDVYNRLRAKEQEKTD